MKKNLLVIVLICVVLVPTQAQIMQQAVESPRAGNPNAELAKALSKTGTLSLSIGVPVLAAGLASILYAELLPNPVEGYTTSQSTAAENSALMYMPTEAYITKMQSYNGKVHAAQNAAYIMIPLGGALTIVGIPLYCYGKKLGELNLNYTGNGTSVSVNF